MDYLSKVSFSIYVRSHPFSPQEHCCTTLPTLFSMETLLFFFFLESTPSANYNPFQQNLENCVFLLYLFFFLPFSLKPTPKGLYPHHCTKVVLVKIMIPTLLNPRINSQSLYYFIWLICLLSLIGFLHLIFRIPPSLLSSYLLATF